MEELQTDQNYAVDLVGFVPTISGCRAFIPEHITLDIHVLPWTYFPGHTPFDILPYILDILPRHMNLQTRTISPFANSKNYAKARRLYSSLCFLPNRNCFVFTLILSSNL